MGTGEEYRCQPPCPNKATQLPEREKRDEGDHEHEHARENLIDADLTDIVQAAPQTLLVEPSLDEMLDDAECQHEDAEQDRLVEDWHD